MKSPILWQNSDCTVTLLDIPQSIAHAQAFLDAPSHLHLVSSAPPVVPFPTNEPKSPATRAALERNSVHPELHAEHKALLGQAMSDVKRNHQGAWCLPRPFVEEAPRPVKKRRLVHDDGGEPLTSIPDSTLIHNEFPGQFSLSALHRNASGDHVYLKNSADSTSDEDSDTHFYCNKKNDATYLDLQSATSNDNCTYIVPPRASFLLEDCSDSRSFHASIRNQAQQHDSRREFDFILLDPPWPNRSVKRTHKTPGSTYSTSPSLWDTRNLILDTNLDVLMADECLVGIWITNKPAVREIVLSGDGIFACWGVELVEEWLWLKTTTIGEPVTPLSGVWRKPYEVLLLGRKRRKRIQNAHSSQQQNTVDTKITRRTIIGVPDLHSRKPCLKELIEPFMHDKENYRALEVFARHLVAGWWSWGNECTKFNWRGFWCDKPNHSANMISSRGDRT